MQGPQIQFKLVTRPVGWDIFAGLFAILIGNPISRQIVIVSRLPVILTTILSTSLLRLAGCRA